MNLQKLILKGLLFSLLLPFVLLFPSISYAKPQPSLHAAYIKDGDLWIKNGHKDQRITSDKNNSYPLWSSDGTRVAYLKNESDLWVYYPKRKTRHHIATRVSNVQWAPQENILAYKMDSVLNVSDLRTWEPSPFRNAAFGIDNYSWLPDGNGFLASSSANLLPDGWTKPQLFKVFLNPDLSTKEVKEFFSIPTTLIYDGVTVMSIGTSSFKWSSDKKWIAFIVTQTASLSADGNMLTVLSSDGKQLLPLGVILDQSQWLGWAPSGLKIASIQGSGREATQNKALTVQSPPSTQPMVFTPTGYVDVDFTWKYDDNFIVSRMKAFRITEDSTQSEYPALYRIIGQNDQVKITAPPDGFGDFYPQFHTRLQKLTWVRSNESKTSVWMSDPVEKRTSIWINNIDAVPDYYGQRDWSAVLDFCD